MTPSAESHPSFRNIPLFVGCTSEELSEIDRLSDQVRISAGRTVLTQGDLGQEFALIVEGEAEVVKDGTPVATLGPGDYFGEVALLDAVTRTASVVASTDLVLEVLDRRGFNTLLDDLPRLSRSILKGLAHRMAQLEADNERLRSERSN